VKRKQAGLIESAGGEFGAVKRNGDDEKFCGSVESEFGDGVGEHTAQGASGGMEFFVLEGMESAAQWLFVDRVGNSADEGGRSHAADTAKAGAGRRGWRSKSVATTGAGGAGEDWNLNPAERANWHRRKLRQRGAAESTYIGKEGRTECVEGTSEHAGHCAPTGNLRWRNIQRH